MSEIINIFSTQKSFFQQSLSDKSRENGTKHNSGPLVSLLILVT